MIYVGMNTPVDLKKESNKSSEGKDILKLISRFQHSLFHDQINYKTMENLIYTQIVPPIKQDISNLTEDGGKKVFAAFGHFFLSPQYKNSKFKDLLKNKYDLNISAKGTEWREDVDSIDDLIFEQFGRKAFYVMLSSEEQMNYESLVFPNVEENDKLDFSKSKFVENIKGKQYLGQASSWLINVYKKLIVSTTDCKKID